MKARLSSRDYPAAGSASTSREPDDPAIALLDAWATVGDVLTLLSGADRQRGLPAHRDRAALRARAGAAGRLPPRPGVAASVYLAYTIDDKFTEEALIPAGSRAQSVPGPGETAQSFETSEDLKARATWNNLRPRV